MRLLDIGSARECPADERRHAEHRHDFVRYRRDVEAPRLAAADEVDRTTGTRAEIVERRLRCFRSR
jgi:hypothetical protein